MKINMNVGKTFPLLAFLIALVLSLGLFLAKENIKMQKQEIDSLQGRVHNLEIMINYELTRPARLNMIAKRLDQIR